MTAWPSSTRELPSYWLTGWMRFHTPTGLVPYSLWNDRFPPGVPYPSVAVGAVGVGGLLLVCVAAAGLIFPPLDIDA